MKKDNTKIKYFLYARKSSESEDRQVQSIDDQIKRLKELADNSGLIIKKVITEAKSAKQPNNRPLFDDMLTRIERGEADGILCWQINRLSRNPIDSGKLSWLLQRGVLKSIQTIDREYLPSDNVIIFNVESGQANQFILDLRKNTVRGMESKLEKGWSPNMAPLGYLNTPEKPQGEKTIRPDPERLPLIRKMWDLMLTGNYSVRKILDIANNEWGFRTRSGKRRGGKPLSYSGIYKVLTSKYYAGFIQWDGKEYKGQQEAIITLEEYDRVQELFGRKGKAKPKKHEFAFTGLIHCEECGCLFTAEEKHKLIKSTGENATYIYYRCTKRKKDIKCGQPSLKQEELDAQIEQELAKYTILPEFRQWALEILNEKNDQEIQDRGTIHETQTKALLESQKQLDNLTQMRYRDLIDDKEYLKGKTKLQNEINTLREKIVQTQSRADNWLELTEKTFDFATYARYHFMNGDLQKKKEIAAALGSNYTIRDRKLSIQANEWLKPIAESYPALEKEYLRLEPTKLPMNKAKTEALTSVRARWGRALSGVITVLEDRGYMITVREKMNNIKKVAKFYNYDFLATTSHQLPPVLDKSRT